MGYYGAVEVSIENLTNTEIGYLDGVTSAIQTQIDSKANQSTTYTKTEVDNNFMLKQTAPIFTSSLFFQDVLNSGVNTLAIKGGVNINFTDIYNVDILDLRGSIIDVNVHLKCHSTAEFVGNITAPNITNMQTQINNLSQNSGGGGT